MVVRGCFAEAPIVLLCDIVHGSIRQSSVGGTRTLPLTHETSVTVQRFSGCMRVRRAICAL